MSLLKQISTILLMGLVVLAAETIADDWTNDRSNVGLNPIFSREQDDKELNKLKKRYREVQKEYRASLKRDFELGMELESLTPGTSKYRKVKTKFDKNEKRKDKVYEEKKKLEDRLFPCGMDSDRKYQSKFVLNVINESSVQVNVYGNEEKYGILYGQLAPGGEADYRLAIDAIKKVSNVDAFPVRIVATYPDGTMIPARAGFRRTIRKNYRVVYPERNPCITYYTLLLTESDFGVSAAIPKQQIEYSIYMDRVSYYGRTINNGRRNDLTIYFTGRPKWPVTARLTATACPPGVSCPPVSMTFTSSSIKNRNAVIMPKVLYCTGFRRSMSIGAQVVLKDSAGNETIPAKVTTHCIVK